MERDHTFRGHGDIFVAGIGAGSSAATRSQQAADQRSFSTTGEATNQSTRATTTTGENGCPFSFSGY